MLGRTVCRGLVLLLTLASVALAKDEWYLDLSFDEACKKAKAEDKLVFIDFYSPSCGWCVQLEKRTFSKTEVRAWLSENSIPIRIDGTKEMKLARKFSVRGYPCLVFLRAGAVEIGRIAGFCEAKQFLEMANGFAKPRYTVRDAKKKLREVGSQNPFYRMNVAEAYAYEGKPKEALSQYLNCFTSGGRKHPEFIGWQASIIPQKMAAMRGYYSKADRELTKRHDKALKTLKKGRGKEKDVLAYAALHPHLADTPEEVIQVYDEVRAMKKAKPETKAAFASVLLVPLVEAQRYDDIAEDLDVVKAFERELPAFDTTDPGDKRGRSVLLERLGAYYEILLATDRRADAQKAARSVMEKDDQPDTCCALARGACRSGKATEEDLALAQKAYDATQGRDVEIVETLARLFSAVGQKQDAIALVREASGAASNESDRETLDRCLAELKK